MTRAQDAVRGPRRDAGVIGGSAVARRPSPTGVADTLAALAGTVVGAQLTLISVAGKVVALAEVSRYYLRRKK